MSEKLPNRLKQSLRSLTRRNLSSPEQALPTLVGVPEVLQPMSLEPRFVDRFSILQNKNNDAVQSNNELTAEIEQFMKEHGVCTDPADPSFDKDLHDSVTFAAKEMAFQTVDGWKDRKGPSTDKSPRETYIDELEKHYSKPIWDKMADHGETTDELLRQTEDYSKQLAEELATRSRNIVFTDKQHIESVKEDLSGMIRAMATELYVSEEGTKDHDELVQDIEDFIDDQMRLVANHMAEVRIERASSHNRFFKWASQKWASWGPQDMSGDHKMTSLETWKHLFSKETLTGNLKKSVVMMGATAVGGLIAAPVAAAAGATGGIVAGTVAGGMWVANRVAKTIASQKLTAAGTERTVAESQRQEINLLFRNIADRDDDEAAVERIKYIDQEIAANLLSGKNNTALESEKAELQLQLENQFHDRLLDGMTEKVDSIWRRNRNRLIGGIGLGLAFGGVGVGLAHTVEVPDAISQRVSNMSGKARGVVDQISNMYNSHVGDTSVPGGNGGYSSGAAAPMPHEGALPTTGMRGAEYNKTASLPPSNKLPMLGGNGSVAATPEQYDAYVAEHAAGATVTKGEGWYQTFQELGVKRSDQAALLKELGPQLEEMGWAQKHGDSWWISHPGKLPADVTRLIVEKANGHGYLEGSTGATSDALSHISRGEGVLNSLHEAGLKDANLNDVANVGPALEQAGVAYQAPELGGYGLNYSGGTMSEQGVKIFEDYAADRKLDQATQSLDQVVNSFATEHGLNDVHSLDQLLTDVKSGEANIPGLSKVITAGDVNHNGSLLDEMRSYLMKSSANKVYFTDALRQAANAHEFGALDKFQSVINAAGKELADLSYALPDGTLRGVATFDTKTGNYHLSDVGENLPEAARQILDKVARRTDYGLAA